MKNECECEFEAALETQAVVRGFIDHLVDELPFPKKMQALAVQTMIDESANDTQKALRLAKRLKSGEVSEGVWLNGFVKAMRGRTFKKSDYENFKDVLKATSQQLLKEIENDTQGNI